MNWVWQTVFSKYLPLNVLFCNVTLTFPHYLGWTYIEYGRSDTLGLLRQERKKPYSFHLDLLESHSWAAPPKNCCYAIRDISHIERPWADAQEGRPS